MEKQILIEVDQVSRYYGEFRAVHNVSFTVQRGEVLGFLGPNGAGKSTTMQIICGVQTASEGRVSIAGHDIFEEPVAAKAHIGFLPETPPLYSELTVDEYLTYAARLRNIPGAQIRQAMDNCKQRCGLAETGRRLIRNLSRGYQQRVGIAQAIIHSPAVVILDEPTSGLDPIQIREIRDLIRELGNDHSVILSTHILPEVQTLCDRVLIIHQGRLVLDEKLEVLNSSRDQSLQLAFTRPPSLAALQALEGIDEVQAIDAQRFRVVLADTHGGHDQICRAALDHDWGLTAMVPGTQTLEEIFLQLTSEDIVNKEDRECA